jgi:DNA-binding transcriptional MerR regulator
MPERSYLRSGELARSAGVSPDTLRHYERLKLIAVPRRSPGNYRLYPPDTVDRVRLIRRALAVGFSLAELARILKVRDAGGAPCRQAKWLLEEKLSQVERQITDLAAMRDHLRVVLEDWDNRLSATQDGNQARLLETLAKDQHYEKTSRTRALGGRNHRL